MERVGALGAWCFTPLREKGGEEEEGRREEEGGKERGEERGRGEGERGKGEEEGEGQMMTTPSCMGCLQDVTSRHSTGVTWRMESFLNVLKGYINYRTRSKCKLGKPPKIFQLLASNNLVNDLGFNCVQIVQSVHSLSASFPDPQYGNC